VEQVAHPPKDCVFTCAAQDGVGSSSLATPALEQLINHATTAGNVLLQGHKE
jgi:hypothetical protein